MTPFVKDSLYLNILGATEPLLDPVVTLQHYMPLTVQLRSGSDIPLFISLTRSYSALSAASIAGILNEAISLAGVSGRGY